MRTAKLYRQYAEDCRRIARNMPVEQRAKLLEIANAWVACAENLETRESVDEDDRDGARTMGMFWPRPVPMARPEWSLRCLPP